jgi:hypothetical protein
VNAKAAANSAAEVTDHLIGRGLFVLTDHQESPVIRFARSTAVVCLVLSASLSAVPAAQAAPSWKIQSCHFDLHPYWLPKQVTSGIFISCTTTADRNQQINDALTSGNPTRVTNALHAGLQQNADTFLTPESPCEPGQQAAMGDAYAECAG